MLTYFLLLGLSFSSITRELSFRHAAESFCMKYGLCLPTPQNHLKALGVTADPHQQTDRLCLVGLLNVDRNVLFFFFFFF